MPSRKQPEAGAEEPPDLTAYYEIAGTKILIAYAREEMSGSVARLKRYLHAAFEKPEPQRPRTEPRRQS